MRFVWFLCRDIYHTTPDDPRITDMDPVQKLWMYENWLADQNEQAELAKNHAYLLASFWNPEAVQSILGGNVYDTTEEEFEESTRIVREQSLKMQKELESQQKRKRRRRKRTPKGQ